MRIRRACLVAGALGLLFVCCMGIAVAAQPDNLQAGFTDPPAAARPWVYWFWLNGNVTRIGIKDDLEAMQRVGIGGVLIMEVDQDTPKGPVAFASPEWREMFHYACFEAHQLGLEVNMTNDAGWCGSGGPWITPALSMKKVVWSETRLNGGAQVNVPLAQPETVLGFYKDIDIIAFPSPAVDSYRIGDIGGKSALDVQELPPAPATYAELPASQMIPATEIVHLLPHFHDGTLTWNPPAGRWTILRMGYTSTGVMNHPAPEAGLGLESDKLSREATDFHFDHLMAKLLADNPPPMSALVSTHIDSWETGSQNWTATFREDFERLRGYDPDLYLPVMTGRVITSLEVSERFLWDLRLTVSQLLDQNYAGRMEELAKAHGIRLSIEAYGSPTDDLAYAGRADEPMTEFWATGEGGGYTDEMASAAHIYGKPILGAESFTSDQSERWLDSPASLKAEGDWALCDGVQRFVIHRYAMQPWADRRPGMSMGPWGLHYERTQTWWNQSKPWHEYLTRCQYMLRKGLFVADICYLQPEGSPRAFAAPMPGQGQLYSTRPGYNFDGCNAEAVLTRMSVKKGLIVLPNGMSYRVLALPDVETMTPELLAKIADLVRAGATALGPPPRKSPSLCGYPGCDARVQALAGALWGDWNGKTVTQHKYGRGLVVWGRSAAQVLQARNVPPDFWAGPGDCFRYIHRRMADGTEIYFVANERDTAQTRECTFRVAGKEPEFWWPETGKTEPVMAFRQNSATTTIPIALSGLQSVFVVFKPGARRPVFNDTSFSGAAPAPKIEITRAVYGVLSDPARTLDVRAELQKMVDSGADSIKVADLAAGDDPAYGIVKTLRADYRVGSRSYHLVGTDPETIPIVQPRTSVSFRLKSVGSKIVLQAWKNGRYTLTLQTGRTLTYTVADVPKPQEVAGPWKVTFGPHLGAPAQIRMQTLQSWSDNSDSGVRYFSGTATYSTTFDVPAGSVPRSVAIDLGDVCKIAEITLNNKDLGVLWHAPYRLDITRAVRPGTNRLVIQVTNLWINRMIGDEHLPPDSQRDADGRLLSWPAWLSTDAPSPTGRITFTTRPLWGSDDPLQPSGLLGPVAVSFSRDITVAIDGKPSR